MTKKSIADASADLYKLLDGFTPEERARIVKGTLLLLGDTPLGVDASSDPTGSKSIAGNSASSDILRDAKAFFDYKTPNSKIEELVTAARFRELTGNADKHTKEQFASIVQAARRNFDTNNFKRDLNNARNGGFFNKGGSEKDGFMLSYYGQNYVDALPDREKLKNLKKPKMTGLRKSKTDKEASTPKKQ